MRYERNGWIRSMLALMLALALGGGMTAAVASEHEEQKEEGKENQQQSEQQRDGEEGDSDDYGEFDPTESFGSAIGGDDGSPLGDDSEEEE